MATLPRPTTNSPSVFQRAVRGHKDLQRETDLNSLTHGGHLGHAGRVRPVQKARLVVVDVLHLDHELGLRLHGPGRGAVAGLGAQCVVGLGLAVQPLGGVDVARVRVDGEDGGSALSAQHVGHLTVAPVHVRVELQGGQGFSLEDRDSVWRTGIQSGGGQGFSLEDRDSVWSRTGIQSGGPGFSLEEDRDSVWRRTGIQSGGPGFNLEEDRDSVWQN